MKYIVAMDRVIGGEYEYLPIVACDIERPENPEWLKWE